ncbi:MAG: hypothetical protein ACI9M3_002012, partial [Bacteroidia bacterium]
MKYTKNIIPIAVKEVKAVEQIRFIDGTFNRGDALFLFFYLGFNLNNLKNMKKNYKRNWLFALKSFTVFGALLFAGTASAQLNGTYTIDASTGDFASFAELQDTLDDDGISGPVVINVASDTFNEDFVLNEITGSSSTNTITINGGNALLTNSSGETINVEDAEYITFKNLRIQTNNSTGICMRIEGESSHIMVDSCEFIKRNGSRFSSNSVYLFVTGVANVFSYSPDLQTDITISNKTFHNGDLNDNNSGGYAAIVVYQDPSEDDNHNVKIINNDIKDW